MVSQIQCNSAIIDEYYWKNYMDVFTKMIGTQQTAITPISVLKGFYQDSVQIDCRTYPGDHRTTKLTIPEGCVIEPVFSTVSLVNDNTINRNTSRISYTCMGNQGLDEPCNTEFLKVGASHLN